MSLKSEPSSEPVHIAALGCVWGWDGSCSCLVEMLVQSCRKAPTPTVTVQVEYPPQHASMTAVERTYKTVKARFWP